MSFVYTDPGTSEKDHVRLLVGDTDEKSALLSDEEIEFFIAEAGNVYWAASSACEAMAASVAREVSNSLEGASAQLSDQYQNLKEQARMLRIDAQRKGGTSVKRTGGVLASGTEREPTFSLGMNDNEGADGASLTSPMG